MKSFTKKQEELKELSKKLSGSRITIFTSFSPGEGIVSGKGEKGLSVSQIRGLKKALKEVNSEYIVIKKTLIGRALKKLGREGVSLPEMKGSVGLVIGNDDIYTVSKKIYEFARKNEALKFWGAVLKDGMIGEEVFLEIAKMPSRDTLIMKLLWMLTYPMRGLTVVLAETAKNKA